MLSKLLQWKKKLEKRDEWVWKQEWKFYWEEQERDWPKFGFEIVSPIHLLWPGDPEGCLICAYLENEYPGNAEKLEGLLSARYENEEQMEIIQKRREEAIKKMKLRFARGEMKKNVRNDGVNDKPQVIKRSFNVVGAAVTVIVSRNSKAFDCVGTKNNKYIRYDYKFLLLPSLSQLSIPAEYGRVREDGIELNLFTRVVKEGDITGKMIKKRIADIEPEVIPYYTTFLASFSAFSGEAGDFRKGQILRVTLDCFRWSANEEKGYKERNMISAYAPTPFRVNLAELVCKDLATLDKTHHLLQNVLFPPGMIIRGDKDEQYSVANHVAPLRLCAEWKEGSEITIEEIVGDRMASEFKGIFVEQTIFPQELSECTSKNAADVVTLNIDVPCLVHTWDFLGEAPLALHLLIVNFRTNSNDMALLDQLGFSSNPLLEQNIKYTFNQANNQCAEFLLNYLAILHPYVYISPDVGGSQTDIGTSYSSMLRRNIDATTVSSVLMVMMPNFVQFLQDYAIPLDSETTKGWCTIDTNPIPITVVPGRVFIISYTGKTYVPKPFRLFYLPRSPLEEAVLEQLHEKVRELGEEAPRYCTQHFNAHQALPLRETSLSFSVSPSVAFSRRGYFFAVAD